jgi:hypothetical protein
LLPVVYSYDGVYRPDDGSNELKHVVLWQVLKNLLTTL